MSSIRDEPSSLIDFRRKGCYSHSGWLKGRCGSFLLPSALEQFDDLVRRLSGETIIDGFKMSDADHDITFMKGALSCLKLLLNINPRG